MRLDTFFKYTNQLIKDNDHSKLGSFSNIQKKNKKKQYHHILSFINIISQIRLCYIYIHKLYYFK